MSLSKYNSKRKLSLFIFLIINLFLLLGLRKFRFGSHENRRYSYYSVSITWNGMESSFLERNVAVPLERMLFSMKGLLDVNTIITNENVSVYLVYDINEDDKYIYTVISECLDKLYSDLPLSVQKPVVSQSAINNHPVFQICLENESNNESLSFYAEHVIKSRFEKIKGVTQVIVSGSKTKEIKIGLNGEKASYYGIDPQKISSIIQDGNLIVPSLNIKQDLRKEIVYFNSRFSNFEEISDSNVAINNEIIPLSKIIDVNEDFKEQKEIVRINGLETISIAVMSSGDGNVIPIASHCRKILSELGFSGNKYKVIIDEGKTQMDLIKDVITALIQSVVLVFLIVPFFYSPKKTALLLVCAIIVNLLWTFLILCTLGLDVDKNVIVGITVSLGLVADPFLIISELRESCIGQEQFFRKFHQVVPSILLSLFTTIIVLIPIYFSKSIVPGIDVLSISISISLIVSNVLALGFFPYVIAYFDMVKKIGFSPKSFFFFYSKNYKHAFIIFLFASLASLAMLVFMKKNLSYKKDSEVIYGTVEYQKDMKCNLIDKDMKLFCAEISKIPSVNYCRVESKKGRAELVIKLYDKKNRNSTIEMIKNISPQPGGFVYFDDAENSINSCTGVHINICGDEYSECRRLAVNTSADLLTKEYVNSSVLNFKMDGNYVRIKPYREVLSRIGITPLDLSQTIFWNNGKPVIDKWMNNIVEMDMVLEDSSCDVADMNFIRGISVPVSDGTIKAEFLADISVRENCERRTRKNCRPCAAFTVEIKNNSLSGSIKLIKEYLASVNLPEGYVFVLDMEDENLSEDYIALSKIVCACALLIFFLLCAMTEKIRNSFLMISIVPVSMTLPLLIKFINGKPLVMGDFLGIALSAGITVNSTIAIICQKEPDIKLCYRNKMKSIVVTSITTMAGAVPVLFAGNKDCGYDLAFFMFFSTIGSLIAIVKIFPALLAGRKINGHGVFLQLPCRKKI